MRALRPVRLPERPVRLARRNLATRTTTTSVTMGKEEEETTVARDAAFYERWGARRVYFYQVDLRGRLFLDSHKLVRRNDATCLKSRDFLDFFFRHVRRSPLGEDVSAATRSATWREALGLFAREYPYMSPCGRELNLVRADDTPIVFRDLVDNGDKSGEDLIYGASLREPFDPSRLFVGEETQRIYYTRASGEACLVDANLAQRLSKGFAQDGGEWWEYKGKRYSLPTK